jgi:thymus-specific serine protease
MFKVIAAQAAFLLFTQKTVYSLTTRRHVNNLNLHLLTNKTFDYDSVEEILFAQKLDHFNPQDSVTFNQRYFVDKTYYTSPDAPVFLCVGGEGPPLDKSVLVSSVHCNDMVELAQQRGALLLALEHRFYGVSTPTPRNFSTSSLKYLSTEQALEDLASFQQMITTSMGLTSANKWVTFGGSYPGMVAAFARLKFPNLIHASVSSSSPVEAMVDFPGYNNVVAQSTANPIVGGSDACLAVVVDGHKAIGELLMNEAGRRSLEKTFNVCKPKSLDDPHNQVVFAGDGVIYIPAQSNDPSCTTPYCDIASICTYLTSEPATPPLERLAAFSSEQRGGGCMTVSFDSELAFYANEKNPDRSWLYQTCTEWGFYQTCEVGSECPYTQGLHTLDIDFEFCAAAFGLNADTVTTLVGSTNGRYGGAGNIQSTRIMFPNGEIDPWRAGGVSQSPEGSSEEPILLVKGASHHFWTHPSLPTDSEYVNEARQAIWNQVNAWLDVK